MREVDPPEELGPREVVVIQPYGPLFFATASILLEQLPTVTPSSRQSVVILRARGADEAGATLIEVLGAYAALLREVDSKLVIVTDNGRLVAQLRDVSVVDVIDSADIYRGNEYLGETVRRAYTEALGWIERQPRVEGDPSDDPTGVDT
jgi:sulfate permease, SulP family